MSGARDDAKHDASGDATRGTQGETPGQTPGDRPSRTPGSAGETRDARRVVNVRETPFLPYDMEGPLQEDITWLPVSWDETSGQGSYLMRMEPGAVTLEHEHSGFEEFLIIEGDLVDDDGHRFGPGDFVSYRGGVHSSRTEGGCLIAVFEWTPPAAT